MLAKAFLFLPWLKEKFTQLKERWRNFSNARKRAVVGGVALTGIAAVAGGTIFSFALGGILVNTMFWWMISESPKVMEMMEKKGQWIDVMLTVGAFFGSGGVFSAWMTGMMATAYFTVFRKVLAPPPVPVIKIEPKEERGASC